MDILYLIITSQYTQAVAIALAFLLLAKLIAFLSQKYFKSWAAKTESTLDDIIVEKLRPPFIYIIFIFGLQIALNHLETNIYWLEPLLSSIMVIFVAYALLIIFEVVLKFFVERYNRKNPSKMINSIIPLFKKTVVVILIIGSLIWILGIWGVNITPFLASLGIAGFVIGFAMQDSLKNIFGGIFMILDKSVQVGDRISLDSGEMGLVYEVSIRTTKIKTFSNEILTIPNGQLSEMKITNYTQPDASLRVVIEFSTAYGSDINLVKKIIEEAIKKIENIESDPPVRALMLKLADSGLDWLLFFWVKNQADAFDKKIEALQIVYETLNKEGIEIPFPTRSIFMKNNSSK
jgi:MscS family membrane protein